MNRRTFISASLASAVALSLPGSALAYVRSSKQESKIKLGMHVWVYAKHQPNYDVSNILPQIWQDVAYAGLEGIELMEQPLRRQDKTAEIGELISQHSLPLVGTSYGADFWDKQKANVIHEDLDNIFSNMKTLQARTIGVSVKHPQGRLKTQDEFDDQADLLMKVRALAKQNNIVLNLHNHTYEVENDLYDLSNTLARIPDIKLGPDINWLIRAGVEPHAFLTRFADNIVFLHLRDQHANGKWAESIGEGDTDFSRLGKTIRAIGFEGDAMIELAHEDGFEPKRPVRESLRMSRLKMQEVLS